MFNWKLKATNAIYLEDAIGHEGRPFKSRFLQAGLVKYDFGVCLLKKETIDKFVNTFVECPVIIDHKDDITESDKVGTIQKIWFSSDDGWFWCSGIITDNKAVELIENGYNVSCQYRITDYAENAEGKLHNANPYDKEILDGVFEHLAIVENPRYEDAFIAVNAYIASNKEFNEEDHPRDAEGKFTDGSEDYFQKWEDAPEIKLKGSDLDKYEDIKELRKAAQEYYKNNLQGTEINHPQLGNIRLSGKGLKEYMHTTGDADKLRVVPQIPDIIKSGKVGEFEPAHKDRKDNIAGFYPIYANLKTSSGNKKAETLIGKDKQGKLFYTMFLDYNRLQAQKQRDNTSDQDRLSLSNSITDFNLFFNPNITISKGRNKYNKVFDYIRNTKGESMDNETKGLFSQLLDALKARNEAEDEKDKKECDKASNEDVDKRKLIDEVGGILKGKVDEEVWRTIIGKIEKVAYDKSEAGTADNKAKNEDDEDPKKEDKKDEKSAENKCKNEDEKDYEKLYTDLKEKVEKEAENKAKNSLDEAVNRLYEALTPSSEDKYVSAVNGIELGKQIYG